MTLQYEHFKAYLFRFGYKKNGGGKPPERFRFQGGLKYFNLKCLLWGHLLTISFLELRISDGLAKAMCVFSERQVSQ